MNGSLRPKVGLALSGGGMRGAAHIGVLQFLLERQLPIDVIGGTSAGSIVSMLYGLGWDPRKMREWTKELSSYHLFDFVNWFPVLPLMGLKVLLDYFSLSTQWMPPLPMGLIKGRSLMRMLMQVSRGIGFEQLRLPTVIPAVDIYTGKQIVFCSPSVGSMIKPGLEDNSSVMTNQPVAVAVRASSSIPGVFDPVRIGPYALVDGAVRNNVPADLVRLAGADFVIAVDLGFSLQNEESVDNILEVLQQSTAIMGQEISRLKSRQYANVIICPKTGTAGLHEFDKIPQIVESGYQAAAAAWPRIYQLYHHYRRTWKFQSF